MIAETRRLLQVLREEFLGDEASMPDIEDPDRWGDFVSNLVNSTATDHESLWHRSGRLLAVRTTDEMGGSPSVILAVEVGEF